MTLSGSVTNSVCIFEVNDLPINKSDNEMINWTASGRFLESDAMEFATTNPKDEFVASSSTL